MTQKKVVNKLASELKAKIFINDNSGFIEQYLNMAIDIGRNCKMIHNDYHIYKVDNSGKIEKYNSLNQASKKTGISKELIQDAIKYDLKIDDKYWIRRV